VQLYPSLHVQLALRKHANRADAALIGAYGLYLLQGHPVRRRSTMPLIDDPRTTNPNNARKPRNLRGRHRGGTLEASMPTKPDPPVSNVVWGDDGDLIREVCRLYAVNSDYRICDLTAGRGTFWHKVDAELRARVFVSDLVPMPERLPFPDGICQIVLIDLEQGSAQPDIRKQYRAALAEGMRVSSHQIWIKCKDRVQLGLRRWLHCEILADALDLGLYGRDLFLLIPREQDAGDRSIHYLWVLERPSGSKLRQIEREGLFDALRPLPLL
jgi:hypothetical protein